MADTDTIPSALNAIIDPVSGKGLIDAGRTSAPRAQKGTVNVILDVTGLDEEVRNELERQIKARLIGVEGIETVRIAMTTEKQTRAIIAVASGKGGVGKSTISANLAIALHRAGRRVGLIDADIYGPSQPRLLDVETVKPKSDNGKPVPIQTAFGIRMLSLGQMVAPGQAIAWRGPMASGALIQMADADWGDTDLLVIDLPPGTGDIQLSMIQKHRPTGAVIVSTPQDLALIDATRAIDLFEKSDVPIIGIVENMAGYACPHCGEVSDPFGNGGAEAAANDKQLPFLARIPLEIDIRRASDAGRPPAAQPGSPFDALAAKVIDWLNQPGSGGLSPQ